MRFQLAIAAVLIGCVVAQMDNVRRGEIIHHHSLEPPFIHDWWQDGVPHWDLGGDTVVTNDFIRLTPQRQSRFGWAWNQQPNDMPWWEFRSSFFVRSRRSPGADGLAYWYVARPYKDREMSKVMGMTPNFVGMGIVLDTYDNDNNRDNPSVSVILNLKGEKSSWDTERDLINDARFRCVYDFRNTERHDPVELIVTYYQRRLTVKLRSRRNAIETTCGDASDIDLPPGYYFGMTATTGGVVDNHDIVNFYVRPLGDTIGDPQLPLKFDHSADGKEKDFWKEGGQQRPEGRASPHVPPQ
jgi:mannose-binding lectin 1